MPGFTPLGGGVSDVACTQLAVDGSDADVMATVDIWPKMSQAQPDGRLVVSRPTAELLVTAHLTRTTQGWKISEYAWSFAPGSGP